MRPTVSGEKPGYGNGVVLGCFWGDIMQKFWSRSACLFAVTLCISGVTVASAGVDNIVNVGLKAKDANVLDPHLSTKSGDKPIFALIFSGLVRFKPGSMSPASLEPDLATSWTTSDDGKVWTFSLRKGVKFHHGYGELTADDVVYSLQRAGDPKRSGVSSDYSSFDKIEAVDKHTVRITLKTIVPSLLGVVANYHGGNIVSKKAAEEMGEGFKQKPIGTGPFMFQEYKPKQGITLVANKDYFRGKPKIDKLEFKFVPSSSSRELAFKNGELDIFTGKREERWVKRMEKNKDLIVDVFEPGELRTLHFNTTIKPLNDVRVRKAIAHALNRDDFIALVGKSVTRKSWSPVPNGYLGHTNDLPKYEYDPAKSKALLKEAGLEKGFKVSAIITKRGSLLKPMQVVQEQLRKVGITLDLEVVEHSAFHAQIRKDLSPMVLYGAARFPIADSYLTQFYHSKSTVGTPTAVTNFSHCDMADKEIDSARKEADPAKQIQLWASAQRKLMENVCSIPLFEQLQVWVRRKSINYNYKLNGALSLGPLFTEASSAK